MVDKEEFAYAMATLLCLDRSMEKDLMKLPVETLVKMYNSYIKNAREANDAIERVHEMYNKQNTPTSGRINSRKENRGNPVGKGKA